MNDNPTVDDDWTPMESALRGLLSLDVRDHSVEAVDFEVLTPPCVLIAHLGRLKGPDQATKITAALGALAGVFARFELARGSHAVSLGVWKRLLTSSGMMLAPLKPGDPRIDRAARNHVERPLTVVLDCSGLRLAPDLFDLLAAFFAMPHPLAHVKHHNNGPMSTRWCRRRKLHVGIKYARSRLQEAALLGIKASLSPTPRASPAADEEAVRKAALASIGHAQQTTQELQGPSLLSDNALACLDLSDSGLSANELDAVAGILVTRPVRELHLENCLARSNADDTIAAWGRLLQAALSGSSSSSDEEVPLALYLDRNSLSWRHFAALADCLEQLPSGQRRLGFLSLANTLSIANAAEREASWRELARICVYTQRGHHHPRDAILDLSGNVLFRRDVEAFCKALTDIVQRQLPRVQQFIDVEGQQIHCLVHRQWRSDLPRAGADDSPSVVVETTTAATLDAHRRYRVLDVVHDHWLRLDSNDDSVGTLVVPASAIKELTVGSENAAAEPLLTMRFNALFLDSISNENARGGIGSLLDVIGANLRRLSMRWVPLPDVEPLLLLDRCPGILDLDLEGCRLFVRNANTLLQHAPGSRLQAINYRGNRIGFQGMTSLWDIYRAHPGLPLRHLNVSQGHIGVAGLEALGKILRCSSHLRVIELDAGPGVDRDPDPLYEDQRRALERQHQGELVGVTPVNAASRLAFVGSLWKRDRSASTMLDMNVLTMILDLAATPIHRRLVWR